MPDVAADFFAAVIRCDPAGRLQSGRQAGTGSCSAFWRPEQHVFSINHASRPDPFGLSKKAKPAVPCHVMPIRF